MKAATQLPLSLPHRPSLSGDDFFVAPANAQAVDWLDRWPDWAGVGIVIHGEQGSGKSHLLEVFAAKTRCLVVTAVMLEGGDIANASAYAVDDADDLLISSPDAAEGLFHLFNQAKSDGAKLMLTAKVPAARWPIALPDLSSRLKTLDSVEIGAPDDTLLAVLLTKQFSDRQIKIEPDVVRYLTSRMERSAATVIELVDALDREALARKQAITVPLARNVLDRLGALQQSSMDI